MPQKAPINCTIEYATRRGKLSPLRRKADNEMAGFRCAPENQSNIVARSISVGVTGDVVGEVDSEGETDAPGDVRARRIAPHCLLHIR